MGKFFNELFDRRGCQRNGQQCDQMARLFFQYLAIFKIDILHYYFCQSRLKIWSTAKNPQPSAAKTFLFCQGGEVRPIWSHWISADRSSPITQSPKISFISTRWTTTGWLSGCRLIVRRLKSTHQKMCHFSVKNSENFFFHLCAFEHLVYS